MATGVSLATLVTNLRSAIGNSLLAAHGVDQEDSMKIELARTQADLWLLYDWPSMAHSELVPALAGQRTTTLLPTKIDFGHINDVSVRAAGGVGGWVPIYYGIGVAQLNQWDSDAAQKADPIKRWQIVDETAGTIEVWPIPNTDQQLRFTGRRALLPFAADADVCTLDGDLIVAMTAVHYLARNKSEDAKLALEKAQALLARHRAIQTSNKRDAWVMTYGDGEYAATTSTVI